jgi:hypothetical protein
MVNIKVYNGRPHGARIMGMKRAELGNPLFLQQSVRNLLELHLLSYSNWVASVEKSQREITSSNFQKAARNIEDGEPSMASSKK